MAVTPKSDYWRISHYGFTVDDAPFYCAEYGGEFEAKVKVTGDYKGAFRSSRHDLAMLWVICKHLYSSCCIYYVYFIPLHC